MRLILHVGMTKTGTTAIQSALARSENALRAHGFANVTSLGRIGNQRDVAARLLTEIEDRRPRNPATEHWLREPVEDPDFIPRVDRTLDAFAERDDADCTILSSEALWDFGTSAEAMSVLRGYLRQRFGHIEVAAYLRRQDAHVVSQFAQEHKGGHVVPFERHVATWEGRGWYDYHACLSSWRDAFGTDRLTVRVYERDQLVGGDSVRDFEAVLGVPTGTLDVPERTNESVDASQLAFLHRVNGVVPLRRDELPTLESRRLLRAVLGVPGNGRRPQMASSAAREFLARFEAGNAAVARDFLGRGDGKLFAEPVEPGDEHLLDIAPDEFVRIAALAMDAIAREADGGERTLKADLRDARSRLKAARERIQRLLSRLERAGRKDSRPAAGTGDLP